MRRHGLGLVMDVRIKRSATVPVENGGKPVST